MSRGPVDRPSSRLGRMLVGVLVRRPDLWPVAVSFVPRHWWRRWPPLPLPPADYLRFRAETMYGAAGSPEREELVRYLEWCRAMRSRAS